MQKWIIKIKSAAKISLNWRPKKQSEHHSDYLRNTSNLIKRHRPLSRITRKNEFCNRRWIWKHNAGKKRIAKRTSATANTAMIIILIIAQNVRYVFPTVFDIHWLVCYWKVLVAFPKTNLHPVNHYQLSFRRYSRDRQNARKHFLSNVGA